MAPVLHRLCILSVFFGLMLSVAPDGGVKRVMNILCAAILILTVLSPLKQLDIGEYALELAKNRELEASFMDDGKELNDRLNRLVIERECEAYIRDKATAMGIDAKALIRARWDSNGLWIPYEIELDCARDERLEAEIIAGLGIPKERQIWKN